MATSAQVETDTTIPTAGKDDRITGIVVGRLVWPGPTDELLVEYPDSPAGRARAPASLVALHPSDAGRDVALAFEDGDTTKPMVLGFMHQPHQARGAPDHHVALDRDGGQLTIRADREIVLQCGKSSLTLTRAGKVLIRGSYLLSRSSGVNRIKGGSVQIN